MRRTTNLFSALAGLSLGLSLLPTPMAAAGESSIELIESLSAASISADASVIVGSFEGQPCRWTSETGAVLLPTPSEGDIKIEDVSPTAA